VAEQGVYRLELVVGISGTAEVKNELRALDNFLESVRRQGTFVSKMKMAPDVRFKDMESKLFGTVEKWLKSFASTALKAAMGVRDLSTGKLAGNSQKARNLSKTAFSLPIEISGDTAVYDGLNKVEQQLESLKAAAVSAADALNFQGKISFDIEDLGEKLTNWYNGTGKQKISDLLTQIAEDNQSAIANIGKQLGAAMAEGFAEGMKENGNSGGESLWRTIFQDVATGTDILTNAVTLYEFFRPKRKGRKTRGGNAANSASKTKKRTPFSWLGELTGKLFNPKASRDKAADEVSKMSKAPNLGSQDEVLPEVGEKMADATDKTKKKSSLRQRLAELTGKLFKPRASRDVAAEEATKRSQAPDLDSKDEVLQEIGNKAAEATDNTKKRNLLGFLVEFAKNLFKPKANRIVADDVFSKTSKVPNLWFQAGGLPDIGGQAASAADPAKKQNVFARIFKNPISKMLGKGTPLSLGVDLLNVATAKPGLERNEAIGEAVGGRAGWAAGAAIGAAIGTAIAPGIGTTIGGFIGGFAGSNVGSKAGEWLARTFTNWFGKKKTPQQPDVSIPQSTVQVHDKQLAELSRSSRDAKHENHIYVQIPDGAVQVQIHEHEVSEEELMNKVGVPLVRSIMTALENRA